MAENETQMDCDPVFISQEDSEDIPQLETDSQNTDAIFKASFPQARIKAVMKLEKEMHNATLDGVYAVSVATEMFLVYC